MKSVQSLLNSVEANMVLKNVLRHDLLDSCDPDSRAIVQRGYEVLEAGGLEAAAVFLSANMSRVLLETRKSLAGRARAPRLERDLAVA
ncbi:MAG: hypothetical protein JWP36_2267 [Paucimonas sp.]|jgi:hypothetical protein|nr:hypothetical protein [Paucimonas sp.]